ncbi:hypothetical protein [Shinella zoogloeoides]|uniref:hypothetical protein n=1 Tax=Shinella zoogloeoides TaxID=352475 RepID=UPI001F597F38|nr:hypothetical protein [Shinella zoogloeoides]
MAETDTYTSPRNTARVRFAATGKAFADLSFEDLQSLRDHIAVEMENVKLIDGTLKMNPRIKAVDWPNGWAALTCRSRYFEDREAVTFSHKTFVGFAGWADADNVKPIITGFHAWCDTLTARGTND